MVKKMPNKNASSECLSLIMLDSVIRVNKKETLQTLLKDCKHKLKNE